MVLLGVVRGCGVVVTTEGFLHFSPQFWLRSGYFLLVALLLAGDVDCSPTPALFEEGDHATPLPRSTLPCSSSTLLFWSLFLSHAFISSSPSRVCSSSSPVFSCWFVFLPLISQGQPPYSASIIFTS